jgi:hypothetical protein
VKVPDATGHTISKPAGKRYCTTHRGEVQSDAGSAVLRNRTTRWICFACQRRRALSTPPVA